MGDANYGFTQNSYRLRVNPFLVKARKTEQTLYLCSRRLLSGLFTTTLLPAGAGVTNIDLRMQDALHKATKHYQWTQDTQDV